MHQDRRNMEEEHFVQEAGDTSDGIGLVTTGIVHGKIKMLDFCGLKIKLIPLFHPAAIIYNRGLIKLWEEDLKIVKEEISLKELPK